MPPHLRALLVKVPNPARDEVVDCFPRSDSKGGGGKPNSGFWGNAGQGRDAKHGDSGSAARFFYSAKASRADRAGSKHPTVKPIALMQWLARLITPPGGTVLDPFAGSGTTGAAAVAEGFSVVLCERENEYVADIRRRLGEPRLVIDLDAFRHEIALLPAAAALQSRLANR